MNLTELKGKATAGELALIEKTEALVAPDVRAGLLKKAVEFLSGNPPDIELRGGSGFDRPRVSQEWFERFRNSLSDG